MNSSNKWKWKRRQNNAAAAAAAAALLRSPLLTVSLLTFLVVIIILLFYHNSNSVLPISTNLSESGLPPICRRSSTSPPENFLWYAPHSGFSNQLSEFKNAVLLSSILNRTLIVPPILDHHAVALGSCPKFRVLSPNDLRLSVWNHSIQLLRHRRYTSMVDIIDLSRLVSESAVRFIDFRVFVSMWCGVKLQVLCSGDTATSSSLFESLSRCGSLLSGYSGNVDNCLYASNGDCRTTVWTYQKHEEDGALDSFQPDEQLKKKKRIPFVRRRRDVKKTLGPGSKAESARVLAFGSLFTGPYKRSESHIDIHEAPNDQSVQSLIRKVEYLPFVSEIISAGKRFAVETIKAPFLCAQLRLLDGQFKNHWEMTFQGLKQKLESLKQKGPLPVHIFVMTDLPTGNWTGSYLGDIAKESDAYKLFVLREGDELVKATSKKIMTAGRGMKVGSSTEHFDVTEKHCRPESSPDILLYMEETVCSCASLGFVGTAGSTIAESIKLTRKHQICWG